MANDDLGKQHTCQRGTPFEFKITWMNMIIAYHHGTKSAAADCIHGIAMTNSLAPWRYGSDFIL